MDYQTHSGYHFNHSKEDIDSIQVEYGSQWIGTIQRKHGHWSFTVVSVDIHLSLTTLIKITEYMEILYTS